MRARSNLFALVSTLSLSLILLGVPLTPAGRAQTPSRKPFRPDRARALSMRADRSHAPARPGAYVPRRGLAKSPARTRALSSSLETRRRPARPAPLKRADAANKTD